MLTALSAMTAAALVLRLAGIFRESLPRPELLAALLAALHLLRFTRPHWRIDQWRETLRAHRFAIGLCAACILALIVRLPGFANDLGHTPLDIDENRLAANVRHFFVTGEVRHAHIEHYPGAVFWVFVASSLLAFLRELGTGLPAAQHQLPVETFAEAARLANIWIAVATTAITGLIGLRLSGIAAGLLGAVMVAIAPISVETTVLVRNDAGMVLAVVAAMHAALVFYDKQKLIWIAAAGALAGLAGAIKYSAVFAVVPVLIAALAARSTRGRMHAIAVALMAFGIAVATSNHFMWADFPNLLRQLADQYAFTGPGHRWSIDNPGVMYLMTLGWAGPGWPMVLLAGAFIVYALATRQPRLWIFVSFPLAYIWFMTQRPLQVARWVYPLVPFVAVGGASALVAAVHWLQTRIALSPTPWLRIGRIAAALAVVAVLWQPVWAGGVSFSRRLHRQTHELAESWIREHATPGTRVLLGQGWLDLSGARVITHRVRDLGARFDAGVEQLGGCDWVVVPEPLFGHPVLRHLGFLQGFYADRSFGGNLGLDYEVYAVPEVPAHTTCGSVAAR